MEKEITKRKWSERGDRKEKAEGENIEGENWQRKWSEKVVWEHRERK